MREPTLTIMPPIRAGSTRTSTETRRPTVRRSCSLSAAELGLAQRLRRGDLGGNLAAALGELLQIGLDHRRDREEATVARDDGEKVADQSRQAGLLARARRSPRPAFRATGSGCAPAATGRGSPPASRAIGADRRRPRRAPALVGEIEQCRGITLSQGRTRRSFRKPIYDDPRWPRRRKGRRSISFVGIGSTARHRHHGTAPELSLTQPRSPCNRRLFAAGAARSPRWAGDGQGGQPAAPERAFLQVRDAKENHSARDPFGSGPSRIRLRCETLVGINRTPDVALVPMVDAHYLVSQSLMC